MQVIIDRLGTSNSNFFVCITIFVTECAFGERACPGKRRTCRQSINLIAFVLEPRKKTRLDVSAPEKDLALAEATIRIEQRFWWRKLVKARIKHIGDAPPAASSR
jgi:hypothetical protein